MVEVVSDNSLKILGTLALVTINRRFLGIYYSFFLTLFLVVKDFGKFGCLIFQIEITKICNKIP